VATVSLPVSRRRRHVRPSRRYLRTSQAAKYIGICSTSLRDPAWREKNRIPTIRLGQLLVFDVLELDQWLAALREHPQNGAR